MFFTLATITDSFISPITAPELRNAALIATAFGLLILIAEVWHRSKAKPPVEWTRKLVHIGGGVICLMLPLAVHSFWIVLVLAVGMCGLFVVSKKKGWLQGIHGVQRTSHGTEFYPMVILLLFLLSADRYWLYVICVLVLAISDSAAALIGSRYGKYRFVVENDTKSLEGAMAFFVVTFFVVLVPMLVWNPLGDQPDARTHYVLTASLLGLLVCCMEITSIEGTDNLWVPLGTWLVLSKTITTNVTDLWFQNISFICVLILLLAVSLTSKLLNVGGALVCCLACYGLWAMASFDWAIVFFLAFGSFLVVSWFNGTPWQIRVRPAVYSLAPAVLVMAVANLLFNSGNFAGYQRLFGPFLAASCVALGQAACNIVMWNRRNRKPNPLIVAPLITLIISAVVGLVCMFRQAFWDPPALIALCAIAVVLVTATVFTLPALPPVHAPVRWLRIRAASSVVAALGMLAIQQLGIGVMWQPL